MMYLTNQRSEVVAEDFLTRGKGGKIPLRQATVDSAELLIGLIKPLFCACIGRLN